MCHNRPPFLELYATLARGMMAEEAEAIGRLTLRLWMAAHQRAYAGLPVHPLVKGGQVMAVLVMN